MAVQKKPNGRPPHAPTEQTREAVKALVVAGMVHDDIARIIGVSDETLRKHYRDELDTGLERAIGNVSNTLLQKALNGDTASIIFFLKVRGKKYGWSERLELTGADGDPMQVQTIRRVIHDPQA